MSNEKIIDRVKKLLRKADADANPSEAERDAAMNMAQRLLMKHGLTMGDVGALDEDAHDREFIHGGEEATINATDPWESTLAHNIAQYFFVHTYRVRWGKGPDGKARITIVIMGRREHVAIFTEVFAYVRDQIRGAGAIEIAARSGIPQQARLYVRRRWVDSGRRLDEFDENLDYAIELAVEELDATDKDERRDLIMAVNECSFHFSKKVESHVRRGKVAPEWVEHLGVWRNSFYDGAITRLAARIRESQQDAVKDAGEPGVALVTTEREQLRDFVNGLDLGLTSNTSKRRSDLSGRAAGQAAANAADIGGARKVRTSGPAQLNR